MAQLPDRDSNGKLPAYAWPGAYPLYYVMNDGESLCPQCANDPSNPVHTDGDADGWRMEGCDVNWEDEELYCAHCSRRIESAYGEPDKDDGSEPEMERDRR